MVDLNTLVSAASDLTLTVAIFINDRGEIAGNGVLPNGDTHAFILIPCGENDNDCGDSAASTSRATWAVQIPQKTNSSSPVLRDAPNRMMRGFDHSSPGWYRGSGVQKQK